MDIVVSRVRASPGELPVEMAERKGLGHPDTICDAIAEECSRTLCRYYLKQFGRILHHNVDKVLLRAGSARPLFGGGEVLAPIELYLAGRATSDVGGVVVPVADLVVEAARTWFGRHLHALDPDKHLRIHCLLRPGSTDLQALFGRLSTAQVPLANDSVIGVGFAPLTDLERAVMTAETCLNSAPVKAACPETGEDVKVLGIRQGPRIRLTVACAFIARHVPSLECYLERREHARLLAIKAVARGAKGKEIAAAVNTADDPAKGSVYLTVTGTSAEAGDDGHTGRGNRASGLITPYRPMSLESAPGKNPVTHPGKLYQVTARRIAETLVSEVADVRAAQVYLAGSIGCPITDPQVVDLQLGLRKGARLDPVLPKVRSLVRYEVEQLPGLWRAIVEGTVTVLE
ncbi:MAG TPA: methionine adenosyltransferase [Gemmatimonadales bacterium]